MPSPLRVTISFALYGSLIRQFAESPLIPVPKVADALVGNTDRSHYIASSLTSNKVPTLREDEMSSIDSISSIHRPYKGENEISPFGTFSPTSDANSFASRSSSFTFRHDHEFTPIDSEPPKGFTWRTKPLQEASSDSGLDRGIESPSAQILREASLLKQKMVTHDDYASPPSDKKESKKVKLRLLAKAIMRLGLRPKSRHSPSVEIVEAPNILHDSELKRPPDRVAQNRLNLFRGPQSTQIEKHIHYLEISRNLATHLNTRDEVEIQVIHRSLSELCTEWIMKHPFEKIPRNYGGPKDLQEEVSNRLSSLASYSRSLESLSAMVSENKLLIQQATRDIIQLFGDDACAIRSLKAMKGWRYIKTNHVLEPFPHLALVARLFGPAGMRAPDSSTSLFSLPAVAHILSHEWDVKIEQVKYLIRVRRLVEMSVSRMKTPAILREKRKDLEQWFTGIIENMAIAIAASRFAEVRVILSTLRKELDPHPSLALVLEQFSFTLPISYFERSEEVKETLPSTEAIIARIKENAGRLDTHIASVPIVEILKTRNPNVRPIPQSSEQAAQETTQDIVRVEQMKTDKELADEDEKILRDGWEAKIARQNLKRTFHRGILNLIEGFDKNSGIIQRDAYVQIKGTLGKHESLEHFVELFDPEKLKGPELDSDLLEMSKIWPKSLNDDFEGNMLHKDILRLREVISQALIEMQPEYKTKFIEQVSSQFVQLENSLEEIFHLDDESTDSVLHKIERWAEEEEGLFPKDSIEFHAEVLLDIFGPMERAHDIPQEYWASVLQNPTEQVPKLREVANQFHHATWMRLNIANELKWTTSLIGEGWSQELMWLLLDGAERGMDVNQRSHWDHSGHQI
ncbi:hypothetical protein DFH28DRAFT_470178 [Melampsora americana]|nr:hypothetical protein DFH28DRAFT_470178 [Melampsora americana]